MVVVRVAVLPDPLMAIRQGDAEPVSKLPLVRNSAFTGWAKRLREINAELSVKAISIIDIVFFDFVLLLSFFPFFEWV